MKMVAASKMRQDVTRLERARSFGVGSIQKVLQNETFLHKKRTPTVPKKELIVPITTDKGLCGGTNSSIIREVKSMVKENRSGFKIFVVGDKGSTALSRPMPDLMEHAITHLYTPLNFPTGTILLIKSLPLLLKLWKNQRIVIEPFLSLMSLRTLSVKFKEKLN